MKVWTEGSGSTEPMVATNWAVCSVKQEVLPGLAISEGLHPEGHLAAVIPVEGGSAKVETFSVDPLDPVEQYSSGPGCRGRAGPRLLLRAAMNCIFFQASFSRINLS